MPNIYRNFHYATLAEFEEQRPMSNVTKENTMSTKNTKTSEEKRIAKAAYDKARRAAKKTAGKTPASKAEVAADRAAVIAEQAEKLKATAGTHGRPMVKAIPFTKLEAKTAAIAASGGSPKLGIPKAAKEPKTKKEPAVRQPTVASVSREMIAKGCTDEAIYAELVKTFKVPDSKKYYPSWYRSQMVRKGDITQDFANAHRHESKA